MICSTTIRNNELTISTKNLSSDPYNISGYGTKKYYLYRIKNNSEGDSFLTVSIKPNGAFYITGSLRKWWFGNKTAVKDFNLKSFIECINLIAKKLKVSEEEFWYSNISNLEIGGNVILNQKYKYIIPAMMSFPRLERSNYKSSYTAFPASKSKIVAYDKIKEVLRNNIKLSNLLCKYVFVLRFEIKIKSISEYSGCRTRINSLFDVRENWNSLLEHWVNTYCKIEFNLIQNPKVISKGKYLNRTEFKEYSLAKAIEVLGQPFFENVIKENCNPSKRSQEKKYMRLVCEKFQRSDSVEYLKHVENEVKRKALRMK